MKICEIFYSIQGESSFAGSPCAFIRLAGCDLRCSYCDTQYAFSGGTEMPVAKILGEIEAFPTHLALVTGGEPMLQDSVHDLLRALLDKNYEVLLETAGHRPLGGVDPRVHKIMDLKCPSSGMERHNDYANIRYLTPGDELKFVVGDRKDFDWACGLIRQYKDALRVGRILVSPVHGQVPLENLAQWILSCGLPVFLGIQLHKIIWPDSDRGK
ncbi:MAG: radical SAM protein [Acidobacteria bacterium]|nr:radical SAM protein [Acidobacteriota bacterium]